MIAIRYRIELLEPALLTGLEGDPNSAVSIDFVPGSALRGAFISTLLRQNRKADLTPYLSNKARFLNGYLVIQGSRSLPLPLSLRKEKNAEETEPVQDMVTDDLFGDSVFLDENGFTKQWKGIGGFASVNNYGTAVTTKVARQLAIHTSRDRRAGTALISSGAIYRYDALAARQIFEALVLCEEQAEADCVTSLLKDIDRLGGAVRAGYGKVCVHLMGTEDDGWKEHPFSIEDTQQKQVVLLLSDALLKDDCGQFTVSPEVLRQAIKPVHSSQGTGFDDAFLDAALTGAFNRTWGLPLPQALAVKHGAVLVLPANTLSEAEIKTLEWSGIGERRSEGFGRVAVFAPVSGWDVTEEDDVNNPDFVTLEEAEDIEFADLISRRLHEAIQSDNVLTLQSTAQTKRNNLKSSQIARLREVILHQTLVEQPDLDCIRIFIGSLTDKTRRQWQKATVGKADLLSWLESYATLQGEFKKETPEIGKIQHEEKAAEQIKRQLRFVDSVLTRMQKAKEVQ